MILVEALSAFDPVVFYWEWVTDEQYHHKRWLRRRRYKKDPRPANVWIGFRSYGSHKYRDLKRKGPHVLDAVIRRLYEECKKTPEGEMLLELIEKYELVRHEKEYPDYKYAPRRREPTDPVEQDNHATEEALFIPFNPIMTPPLVRSASPSSAGSRNEPVTPPHTLPLAGHAVSLFYGATSRTRTVGKSRPGRGRLSERERSIANPTFGTRATSASTYLSVEAPRSQPTANTAGPSSWGTQTNPSLVNAPDHSEHASLPYGHSEYLNMSSNTALGGAYTPVANAQPDYFAPQLCGQAAVGSSGHQYTHEAVAGLSTYALDGYQTVANEYTGMPEYYEQEANVSSGSYYQKPYHQDPTYPVARPSNQYQPQAGPSYGTQQSLGLEFDPEQEQQSLFFDYFAPQTQQPNSLGLDMAQMPQYGYNNPSMDTAGSYGSKSYPEFTPDPYDLLGTGKQGEAMSFPEDTYYSR